MPRKLILEKLLERGLSMKDASLKIGRAHSFLYQFLKVGIPAELRERDRLALAQVLGVPEDALRGPSTTLPKTQYEKNVTTRKNTVHPNLPRTYAGDIEAKIIQAGEAFGLVADLPVFAARTGSGGGLVLSERAVDWAVRPPMLSRVEDGYGIIVSRDFMEPVVRIGSVVLLHPHLPPRVGDLCVFRCEKPDGSVHVRGGEYRGETEDGWKVRQYNPPRDYTLKKSDWQTCHRSVGAYFP